MYRSCTSRLNTSCMQHATNVVFTFINSTVHTFFVCAIITRSHYSSLNASKRLHVSSLDGRPVNSTGRWSLCRYKFIIIYLAAGIFDSTNAHVRVCQLNAVTFRILVFQIRAAAAARRRRDLVCRPSQPRTG